MSTSWFKSIFGDPIEPNWGKILTISMVVHFVFFSCLLFSPDHSRTTFGFPGLVYEVDLVDLPNAGTIKAVKESSVPSTTPSVRNIIKSVSKQPEIKQKKPSRTAEKPIVLAKKVITTLTKAPVKADKLDAEDLLDDAFSELKGIEKTPLDTSTSKTTPVPEKTNNTSGSSGSGQTARGGGNAGSENSLAFTLYMLQVKDKISKNWAYPSVSTDKDDLVAEVAVSISKEGNIIDYGLEKGSSNTLFDQSVLKAVKRSDPLPPLPEGYLKTHEEFVFIFNLSELEGR